MFEILMPRLGFTMLTGVIQRWLKNEGDKVEKGDVLFEVLSDKVSVEVESTYSGYLLKILAKEGQEIPVSEVIGYIGEKDEVLKNDNMDVKAGVQEKETLRDTSQREFDRKNSEKKILISPLAKKIAQEMGIDYLSGQITGTDPGGRISKDDILKYVEMKKNLMMDSTKSTEKTSEIGEFKLEQLSCIPVKGIRKVIAEKMSLSKSTIPHLNLTIKADVKQFIRLRELINERIKSQNLKITYTDLLLKICAIALKENLKINSSYQNGNLIIYKNINIGLAIATSEGLIVPTFYNCDKLNLIDISRKRIEFISKAQEGKLGLEEVTNGTFTITNLGMYSIRSFSPIINPPQGAILGVGEIYKDVAIVNNEIEVSSYMDLTLACDHRIIDGDTGAQFLQRLAELIKYPEMINIY